MTGYPRTRRQRIADAAWLFPIACAFAGIIAAEYTIRQQPPAPPAQPQTPQRCAIA